MNEMCEYEMDLALKFSSIKIRLDLQSGRDCIHIWIKNQLGWMQPRQIK
jgi:hypothetical protein